MTGSMKQIQEVVGILDRSGSMSGKEADTVGGINTMLRELKSNATDHDDIRVSLKLFDHEEVMLWRSISLSSIEELKISEFVPRGQTALLDAIGHTLNFFMEKKLCDPNAYTSCLVYVATDGFENCSKYYNRNSIKKMIENAKEKYNIDVVYLGANQDAILEAGNIGIDPSLAINYNEDDNSTQAVYRAVGRVASAQRSASEGTPFGFTNPERQASQPVPSYTNDIPPLNERHPPTLMRSPRINREH